MPTHIGPTRAKHSQKRSASKRAKAEAPYKQIFDSAVIGLAIVGLDGKVRDVNQALCKMFGYSRDELIEYPFPIPRAPKTKETAAQRTDELEQSNADLRQFAYLASHDLQQPLRAVASYGRLLSDRYGKELDIRGARWISYITESVDHMQHLIHDLFTLAGVGSEVRGFEALNTAVTARCCWDALLVANGNVQASLDTANLPVIVGDAQQIELLFQNLLGNAVKFRRPDIPLEVSIAAERYASPMGTIWEFGVRDNGIGFDMEYGDQIFEIFRRLHSGAEYEGTGIGLALCRKIVERHGGRIWADSVVGEGSTFTFSLYEHHPS